MLQVIEKPQSHRQEQEAAALLISQNRQCVHSDKRAELDYEVNVRTYREIRQIKADAANTRARVKEDPDSGTES